MATKKNERKAVEAAWEIKDRNYYLLSNKTPLTFTLASRHKRSHPLMWFDEESGYSREIRYASNQKSVFADEQTGYSTLEHIVFTNGTLFVPKEKQALQKLLSLYHPQRNRTYAEVDTVREAEDVIDTIELELEALTAAKNIDIDLAEAVVRTNIGSSVSKMTSKEIKRDLLVFAKRDPKLFLEIVNDENISIRNTGIKAVEQGILKLSPDQRTFTWGSNGRKLITVPFDENPYSALTAWFKTDEGVEVYQTIEKRLK